MLRVLIAKDLRRTRRNPLPLAINILIPLVITALVGLTFGGKSDSGALGRIRFALVDEDKTILSDFLRGSANQREGGKYLDPVILERDAALREINDNKISAVLIIPTNFTRHYLSGKTNVSLELIKNPAQSIHPAVMEELLGALVTALNAISRNLQSEFPEWQEVIEGKRDYKEISNLIERAGDKFKAAKKFINPPLVVYEKDPAANSTTANKTTASTNSISATNTPKPAEKKSNPMAETFAYLLVGMAGMFLLFLASNAMTDLHRELRQRTLARFHTLHHQLGPFVAAKILFAVVVLLIASFILLICGGGILFGVAWQHAGSLALLVLGYACFAAGLMAVLVALIPDERKAGALNTIIAMGLGMAGGCLFPPRALPAFLREHITPLLPSYWFVDTARNLQSSGGNVVWVLPLIKLFILSAVLMVVASVLFRRLFRMGARV
ncbi:MAG TPA: ABC transporter permease [Verrucomicrobiae bacterium]|nr:ABC transporter permease [Verrucomicrobiae bacterium]